MSSLDSALNWRVTQKSDQTACAILRRARCLVPGATWWSEPPPETRPILPCIQLDTTPNHGNAQSNHRNHRSLAAGVRLCQAPGTPRLPSSLPMLAPQSPTALKMGLSSRSVTVIVRKSHDRPLSQTPAKRSR